MTLLSVEGWKGEGGEEKGRGSEGGKVVRGGGGIGMEGSEGGRGGRARARTRGNGREGGER